MYALATTKITILRGTTTDDVGDIVDTGEVYKTGIIAALIEKGHQTWDAATQQRRTVRTIHLTLPSGTDIRSTDQVRDEETGLVYAVVDVTQPGAVGIVPDLDVELRRVTGVTP